VETTTHSVIIDQLEEDHEFDWENIAILKEEPQYRKRLVPEMLHIRRQTCGFNLQTDLEGLPRPTFQL